jgi:16S rRNA (cytosine967-C5)-methyltransferase
VSGSEENRGSVRQLAGEILRKVESRDAFADILLDDAYMNASLSDRDRALLTELVYGTLRWRGKIDAQLTRHLRRPLDDSEAFVRNLLRATVYQLLFLDRIPDYAAVNEAVQLAKARNGRKVAGFVNGVLRNVLRQRDRIAHRNPAGDSIPELAIEISHPEWLVRRWIEEFGREEALALMSANNRKPPLVVRANARKTGRDELLELFRLSGITAEPSRWSPQGISINGTPPVTRLPGFEDGLFQVQGEASQLIGYLLSPASGERVLDACAAPGGKTTHLAELMDDVGEVLATDRSARGVRKIIDSAARLGLKSVRTDCTDIAQQSPPSDRLFDRILLDAPCSGLGTLRAHPEIKWRRNEADVARLSTLQSELLKRVADWLKPAGVVVYSTCTLSRPENEGVVEGFLKTDGRFELENAADYLPEQAKSMEQGRYFRALPHRHDTDGFFAARMTKVK